jgi:hypothetical protein
MIKPRLPGLPTMVGLMLVAMAPVVVTFTGPFHMTYDTLKDFQPLIAASVAFLSATLVFRGAMMAYRAAMEKVSLDRQINERDIRRRQRGILMRARYSVFALGQSAIEIRNTITSTMPFVLDPAKIKLIGLEGIDEAWSKLEEFPGKISRPFSALKVEIFNFDYTRSEFPTDRSITVNLNSKEATSVQDLLNHLTEMEKRCTKIFEELELEIADH